MASSEGLLSFDEPAAHYFPSCVKLFLVINGQREKVYPLSFIFGNASRGENNRLAVAD